MDSVQEKKLEQQPARTGKAGENINVIGADEEANYGKAVGASVNQLKRGLKPRHISLISIGGVIGTGLFLGTGTSLHNGGPLGLLLGYIIIGSVCLSIMLCLGEMITLLPIEGGHITLAGRFVDPAFSFALSCNYAINWLITAPTELSAGAVLINYWVSSARISNAVWIVVGMVVVVGINLLGSRAYGEAEFSFASIKIITITGLIILGIAINCGAGPDSNGYIGGEYWRNPGPLVQFRGIEGAKGRFLGFWSVLTNAAFSYIGAEIVGITAGEAINPRRAMKKSIKQIWVRILLFYILGVLIIGLICPSDDSRLGAQSTAFSSPFVIAIERVGIKALPSIINAALLTSALSAASSDVYTSSRAIYGMAINGNLPKFFRLTTKRGLPYVAVTISSLFCCLAFMSVGEGSNTAFGYLSNLTSVAGLGSWWFISVTYIRFHAGMKAQGIPRTSLPFSTPFTIYCAWWATLFIPIVVLFSGYTVFLRGSWNASTFVTNYLPLVWCFVFFFGKKIWSKTKFIKAAEMDYVTDIAEIEAVCFEVAKPTTIWGKLGQMFV